MQKAKVALVEAGIIKSAGRGRISQEGHQWLKEQYDKGVRFSDWPKGKVEVTESKQDGKPAETKVKVVRSTSESTVKVVTELAPYRFPEDEFEAYEIVNGKRKPVSLRECCNTCRVSLVAHYCEEPTYLGDRRVYIIRKK